MALVPHARRSLLAAVGSYALNYGLRQGARFIGNRVGTGLRQQYNNFGMGTVNDHAARVRRGLKRKRFTKPSSKFSKKARRYTRRPTGRFRGRRYTQRRVNRYRGLNTNVTRNDYRILRVSKSVGTLDIGRDASLLQNNFRFPVHLDHWTTQWSREIEAYDEFKLKDVQFVLIPRTVAHATAEPASNVVKTGQIPYIAARVVNPNEVAITSLTPAEIRATPGFRFLPFWSKRRMVMNAAPGIRIESAVHNETGLVAPVDRHRPMPWMRIDANTKALDLAAIELVKPEFESSNGQIWKFDIYVYATIMLRGNKEELIEPY